MYLAISSCDLPGFNHLIEISFTVRINLLCIYVRWFFITYLLSPDGEYRVTEMVQRIITTRQGDQQVNTCLVWCMCTRYEETKRVHYFYVWLIFSLTCNKALGQRNAVGYQRSSFHFISFHFHVHFLSNRTKNILVLCELFFLYYLSQFLCAVRMSDTPISWDLARDFV